MRNEFSRAPSPTAIGARGRGAPRIGTIAHMQGDLPSARRELDAAIALFPELDEPRRLAHALRERGFAECFGGSLPGPRLPRPGDADLPRHRRRPRPRLDASAVGVGRLPGGRFRRRRGQLLEAKEIFEELGDRGGVSWAAGLRAWVAYFQRRFDEAEELALSVESEPRRWGDSWPSLMMQTLLANMRLWTGRLADAEQFAERALDGFRAMDDRYGIMQALAPLNRARAGLGKQADVRRGVEESIALGHTFGELSMALQGAAGVAMHLGLRAGIELAEQVIERHRDRHGRQ